jgi:hypothetical protein
MSAPQAVSSLLHRVDKLVEHDMENNMGPKLAKAAQAAPLLQMAYGHGPQPPAAAAAADEDHPAAAAAAAVDGEVPAAARCHPSSSSSRTTSTAAKAAIVAAAAAAAGEAWDSDEDESSGGDIGLLLHQALRHKLLNMVAVAWVLCCTSSKLQSSLGQVASWPYGPMAGGPVAWGFVGGLCF